MANTLCSGTAQKAPGDAVRLPMDFGDISQLIDGAVVTDGVLVLATNIASYTVTAPALVTAGGTVTGEAIDYPYQISAKFAGGLPGVVYDCVFAITLDDADATTISRTGPLRVV